MNSAMIKLLEGINNKLSVLSGQFQRLNDDIDKLKTTGQDTVDQELDIAKRQQIVRLFHSRVLQLGKEKIYTAPYASSNVIRSWIKPWCTKYEDCVGYEYVF